MWLLLFLAAFVVVLDVVLAVAVFDVGVVLCLSIPLLLVVRSFARFVSASSRAASLGSGALRPEG